MQLQQLQMNWKMKKSTWVRQFAFLLYNGIYLTLSNI